MAHINRRMVFLTGKDGGVAATAAFTEIFGKVTVKIQLHSLTAEADNIFFAAEGQSLPFILHKIEGNFAETDKLSSAVDGSISAALLSYDGKRAEILAYGCLGETCPAAQSLLNKALQNMAGDKIIQDDEQSAETEQSAAVYQTAAESETLKIETVAAENVENIEKIESLEAAYKETFESIKDDKYIVEDTTLKDIDIIAEEDYYKKAEDKSVDIEAEATAEAETKAEQIHFKKPEEEDNRAEITEEKNIKAEAEEDRFKKATRHEPKNAGQYFGEGCFYIFPVKSGRPKNGQSGKKNGGNKMEHYQRIKTRLNKLLAENPADEVLNGIIPNSKFVKIYYAEEKFYSVGIVNEGDIVQYICYGVPAYFSEIPPEEFENLSKWIPADSGDAKGKGYWMIFQSAEDGKYIKT